MRRSEKILMRCFIELLDANQNEHFFERRRRREIIETRAEQRFLLSSCSSGIGAVRFFNESTLNLRRSSFDRREKKREKWRSFRLKSSSAKSSNICFGWKFFSTFRDEKRNSIRPGKFSLPTVFLESEQLRTNVFSSTKSIEPKGKKEKKRTAQLLIFFFRLVAPKERRKEKNTIEQRTFS